MGGTSRGRGRRGPSKTLYRFRAHGSQRSSSGAPRISSRGGVVLFTLAMGLEVLGGLLLYWMLRHDY